MRNSRGTAEKKILYFNFILITASLAISVAKNITNSNFWLDEAGQFWMSMGLNHFSKPLSNPKGFLEIHNANLYGNLDPGGFTQLLRAWIEALGPDTWSLRLFPLTFFILSCILTCAIARELGLKKEIWSIAPLFLFGSPLIHQHAFELRPYSAEAFAWLFCLALCTSWNKIRRKKEKILIASSATLAVLITMRYSVIVPLASLFIYIIIDEAAKIATNKRHINTITEVTNAFKTLLPLAILPAISCITLFIFVLSEQNVAASPPQYVQQLMLKYNNFGNLFLLPIRAIVWIPFALIIANIKSRKLAKTMIFNKSTSAFLAFSCLSVLFLLILSITGKYPLSWYSRWDIGINSIFILNYLIWLDAMSTKNSRCFINHYNRHVCFWYPRGGYTSRTHF